MNNDFIFIATTIEEAAEAQKHMLALGMTVTAETWGGTWVEAKNGKSTGDLIFGSVTITKLPTRKGGKTLARVDGEIIAIMPFWSALNNKHEIRLIGRKVPLAY